MALAPGSRFGTFEIQAMLGAGGMGEVFRARDTRLGRDVALKILPPRFTADRDRLDRFEREARVLASLNHPGIAALYGVEEFEGQRALVIELVDGETLDHRLSHQGRLSPDHALTIARQVADALDAAHDRGLVHRDLKPSNIAITTSGQVKVLDFGVAKSTREDGAGVDTATLAATAPGVIVGTAAYMSPEQARGHAVDKRSDVWAFGCVLFEMLAGRPPFQGATLSDTISLTLTAEPDWQALPASMPRGVRLLLDRCLEKDAARRLRGLGDISLALDEHPRMAPPSRRPAWLAAAAMLVIGVGAIALLRFRVAPAAPPPTVRFEIPWSTQPSESGAFAVSPDSSHLVYAGVGADGVLRMWERAFDALETHSISGTEGELAANSSLFWSPDSQSIGYYADGAVKKIDRDGGAPQLICRVPTIAVGAAWNEQGDVVLGSPTGLLRCPSSGGPPVPLTTVAAADLGTVVHFFPTFLPGARRVLYLQISRVDASRNGLFVADLDLAPGQQSSRRLLETGFSAKYVPGLDRGGRIVFVRDGGLWAVPFDADTLALKGPAVELASSINIFRDSGHFDVNAKTLIYRHGGPGYQMTWLGRTGATLGLVGDPGQYVGLALAPDESRAVVVRENRLNRSDQDLWLIDLRRNTTTRFTADPLPEAMPAWSPAGDALIYALGHDPAAIIRKRLDGDAVETLVSGPPAGIARINPLLAVMISPTHDGRFLIFSVDTRTAKRADIWWAPIGTPGTPAPLVEQDYDQTEASVSRDGQWLAYVSNEAGASQVFARPIAIDGSAGIRVAGPATLVSPQGGRAPRWRADGNELFYLSPTHQIMAVPVARGAFGAPRELFQAPGALPSWAVSRDGERFLLALPVRATRAPTVSVVLNWQSEPSR
jgi:Tol biopolymer transport system component